jgi:hypothetical protein
MTSIRVFVTWGVTVPKNSMACGTLFYLLYTNDSKSIKNSQLVKKIFTGIMKRVKNFKTFNTWLSPWHNGKVVE